MTKKLLDATVYIYTCAFGRKRTSICQCPMRVLFEKCTSQNCTSPNSIYFLQMPSHDFLYIIIWGVNERSVINPFFVKWVTYGISIFRKRVILLLIFGSQKNAIPLKSDFKNCVTFKLFKLQLVYFVLKEERPQTSNDQFLFKFQNRFQLLILI